ncbi:DUF1579 domain-containing protein [Lysobacter cavernae]|uniref:DUF1579 domain-containing protein n=1 Tax=Lysobacter cavernae TaxID=1685901 RepID=A0ABV7RMN5_9GAMM
MKTVQVWLCALALLVALPLAAKEPKAAEPPRMTAGQQAMMEAWEKASSPGAQHQQLAAMAGTWSVKQQMWMDPKSPPMVQTGSATTTAVFGGRHLRQDYRGEWMGKPFEGVGYTGYDNVTGKYYSSWMDSGSTGLFVAHGDYDSARKTYTFKGEMADAAQGGAKVPIRDVLRIVDDDHHTFEMYETRDGKEAKVMQLDYTRQK